MSYRGEDLDLRSPARARTLARGLDSPEGSRDQAASIYNLDSSLATGHRHAVDLARSYGANKVGIGHFTLALTRVEPSATTLCGLGIRSLPSIRGELAAMLMSDTFVVLPRVDRQIGDSAELAAALRATSDAGRVTGKRASLEDFLRVILASFRHIEEVAVVARAIERDQPYRLTPGTLQIAVERTSRPRSLDARPFRDLIVLHGNGGANAGDPSLVTIQRRVAELEVAQQEIAAQTGAINDHLRRMSSGAKRREVIEEVLHGEPDIYSYDDLIERYD